jgi:hypothetical protein
MTEEKNKILLFKTRAAMNTSLVFPNSVLQVAASVEGKYEYVVVDVISKMIHGQKLMNYLSSGEFKFFGSTVMPVPQLKQAIPFSKKIKEQYPEIKITWEDIFQAVNTKWFLYSGYVDFVINGPGDKAFPDLLDAIENKKDFFLSANLIFKAGNEIYHYKKE